MSIKILSKEFRNYDNLLGTPKPFLIGNVGDKYYCKVDFKYSVLREYDLSNSLILSSSTDATGANKLKLINSDSTDWNSLGFQATVGSATKIAVLNYNEYISGILAPVTVSTRVLSINGDEMVLDYNVNAGSQVIPSTDDGNGNYITDVRVYAISSPEQIIASAFHTLNSQNLNQSYIDGTIPNIEFNGVDNMSIGGTISGTLAGSQSGGGLFGNFSLRYTGNNGIERFYSLYFSNTLLPFVDQADLDAGVVPAQYLAQECLTDKIIIQARPDKNNPNIRVDTEVFDTLGNTGYFNETFNGQISDITATITYEDEATGTVLSTLNTAGNTKFTITVSGVTPSNSAWFGLGFALIPSDLQTATFNNNSGQYNLNMLRVLAVGVNIPGLTNTYYGDGPYPMGYKEYNIQRSGNDFIITGVFVPSTALINYLSTADEEDRRFIVWTACNSGFTDIADSDKTSVLCDYQSMQEYIAPVGAWGHDIGFLSRTQENTESESPCNVDIRTEDIIKVKSNFLIGSTVPESLIYRVVASNSTTGQEYDLDRIEFDLSQFPTVGGAKQISISQNRGFQVPNADDYTITIERNASLDAGGNYGYTAVIPLLVRYEDWLDRLGVPSDFYDNTALNNGFNNEWYHYLNTTGWEIKVVLNTDVIVGTRTDRYQDFKTLSFNDYDSNTIISSAFAYYRNSDNQLLTAGGGDGVILDEDVRVECTFTRSTGTWSAGDLTGLYSWVRIEVDAGGGHLTQNEINTEETPLFTSALQPVAGQTELKMELVNSTQIKVSCLVKPNKLELSSRYKLSARLKCK